MANLTITNTFVNGTSSDASQVNTNFSDVKTWLNNRDNGTDYWLNMVVHATVANPAEVKSTATVCELDIDCTGTNGVPFVSLRRSGTTYFSLGVDGADSNKFKIGTTAPATSTFLSISTGGDLTVPVGDFTLSRSNVGGIVNMGILNTDNTNGSSHADVRITSGGSSGGDTYVQYVISGTSTVSVGLDNSDSDKYKVSMSNALGTTDALTITSGLSVVLNNAAIATGATDGFLYIPSCAGTPSGTPTTFAGRVALAWDSTNHKFYVYDGSWRGGTAPGAWS